MFSTYDMMVLVFTHPHGDMLQHDWLIVQPAINWMDVSILG